MGKISISFDHIKDKTKVRELSVVLYTDSFFYGFWDDQGFLVKVDQGPINEFSEIIQSELAAFDIKIGRIMSTAKPYVHIPESEFEEKYFDQYFKGIYPLDKVKAKGKEVDSFIREEICTLHIMDEAIFGEESKLDFPIKKGHISTALANYCYLIDSNYVSYMAHNTLHIAASIQSKFQFYNQFECHHQMDYLYYYMLTLQRLGLDPNNEIVNVGGLITKDSPIYELLYAYIRDIQLKDSALKVEQMTEDDKQFYFDLYLCKSCV